MPNQAVNSALAIYLALFALLVVAGQVVFWDVVPYVAATLLPEIPDPQQLHSATYALLRQELSRNAFESLTSGAYAGDLYRNSDHFWSQLNLYLSKPLYVACLRALHLIGVPPLQAILLLALLPALGIITLLFIWMRKCLQPLHCLIIVICFTYAARLLDLTQAMVHNNLSSFIILAGCYCLLQKRQMRLATILFSASILVRTDNIIFIGLLQLALSWQAWQQRQAADPPPLGWAVGGLLASITIYLLIGTTYEQHWWLLFYHTLVESQVDITAFAQPFSWAIYGDTLRRSVAVLFTPTASIASVLPLFLLLLAIVVPIQSWRDSLSALRHGHRLLTLVDTALLSLPVFMVYLLLFPLIPAWDRFFTHFYVLFSVCAAQMISRCRLSQ